MVKVRLVRNKKEQDAVFRIRNTVFVKEQQCSEAVEFDGLDASAKHAIVLYKNKPVGCARIRFLGKKAKLERIALLKKYRGKGFGKILMNYLISYCRRKKVFEIITNSQYHLKDFYASFGFKCRGKTFMEANIKHIQMYIKN